MFPKRGRRALARVAPQPTLRPAAAVASGPVGPGSHPGGEEPMA